MILWYYDCGIGIKTDALIGAGLFVLREGKYQVSSFPVLQLCL